ncbi:MAG: hypothetical protein P8K68_07065 [Algibacter sp.]|uniref:hypothetical protein n=1 Tax=Algibacter sp. TaxID=1872428 RepID=UPI0026186065|nr:hypothetical protein [Algibacter sp.]MDG1728595.1 hypothetical protein [Algibacter sp.]MDG2178535.1 hypothetical protein [Algibacter sp.]
MNNLEVIILTKGSLKEAVAENKFWGDSYEPPFSLNKAKWMLENTRADNEDVFAVLGYEKHTIIAFVSLMPDFIKKGKGNLKKIFWSQRWWIANNYMNTVLPTYIKSNSLTEAKNQIIVRFLGDDTKAYYEKQPFTLFSERMRYVIVFNLDHKILISKKSGLKKVKTLLRFLDKTSKKITFLINSYKSKKRTKKISYRFISNINNKDWAFIENFCVTDIVPKTQKYIDWQISNNQYHVITEGEVRPKYKCLLESVSNKIHNLSFMVEKEGETIGFISGLVKGGRFVLRYFLANQDDFNHCIDALMANLIKSECTLLQTENTVLAERLKNRYLIVYADSKKLLSLVHNDLDMNFQDTILNDGDGNFL